MAINKEKSAVFAPLKWSGSVVIWAVSFLTNIMLLSSLMFWLDDVYFRRRKGKQLLWLREVWVIGLMVLQALVLAYGNPDGRLMWVVAVYGLIDVLTAALRDIVVSPQIHRDQEGSYISVQNRLRWLLMVPLNLVQVVLCFALLLLYYGEQYVPMINEPMTALYQSALTFTTLGYGDIRPGCCAGRVLVCLELAFFLAFVAIKLPIAISTVRVKEHMS